MSRHAHTRGSDSRCVYVKCPECEWHSQRTPKEDEFPTYGFCPSCLRGVLVRKEPKPRGFSKLCREEDVE